MLVQLHPHYRWSTTEKIQTANDAKNKLHVWSEFDTYLPKLVRDCILKLRYNEQGDPFSPFKYLK